MSGVGAVGQRMAELGGVVVVVAAPAPAPRHLRLDGEAGGRGGGGGGGVGEEEGGVLGVAGVEGGVLGLDEVLDGPVVRRAGGLQRKFTRRITRNSQIIYVVLIWISQE